MTSPTVYQTYVRVPPSIAPYPQAEAIEAELNEALKRARVEVKGWERKDGRVFVTVAADKPVDERTDALSRPVGRVRRRKGRGKIR